jgi:fructosamine-3-kinase
VTFRKDGSADAFAAEAEGLAVLASAGSSVPGVITVGPGFIELEALDLGGKRDWPALAEMLARQHRNIADRYGWHRDNTIGPTPQANGWRESWMDFWRERRMKPQLELALKNGYRIEVPDVSRLLEKHQPPASLLHGDLWNGNVGFTPRGPVIFDPAVYYGDREADLAMTELFGGFPREFYSAYHRAYPLDAGYETRKHLYNLYHLLNHLNLFGRGYLGQVAATLGLLRNALQ